MDAAGAWQPVPILLAMAEPNGPVDQPFFDRMLAEWDQGLRHAGNDGAARRRPHDFGYADTLAATHEQFSEREGQHQGAIELRLFGELGGK